MRRYDTDPCFVPDMGERLIRQSNKRKRLSGRTLSIRNLWDGISSNKKTATTICYARDNDYLVFNFFG